MAEPGFELGQLNFPAKRLSPLHAAPLFPQSPPGSPILSNQLISSG